MLHGKPLKRCKNGEKCVNPLGSLLPATLEFFNANRMTPDGFRGECKACRTAQYYERRNRGYWKHALEYWGNSCAICGLPERAESNTRRLIHEDHWWIPQTEYGALCAANSLPLCVYCNQSKSESDSIQWLFWKLGYEAGKAKLDEIEAYFKWARKEGHILYALFQLNIAPWRDEDLSGLFIGNEIGATSKTPWKRR